MYVANGEPSPHALAGLSVAHVARWIVPEQYRLHRAVLKVAILAVPTQDPHVERRARVALLADTGTRSAWLPVPPPHAR